MPDEKKYTKDLVIERIKNAESQGHKGRSFDNWHLTDEQQKELTDQGYEIIIPDEAKPDGNYRVFVSWMQKDKDFLKGL